MTTLDFETHAIASRPDYPPEPVGLAVRRGSRSVYHAFGHPTGNNDPGGRKTLKALEAAYNGPGPMIFHNAAYELEIMEQHYQLPIPPIDRWEDTLLLGYLNDPRDESISLKPLAEKYLGWLPEEQDELREWVLANIPEAKRAPTRWGAHIAATPGRLAGRYAKGDTDRTKALFDELHPRIVERGMEAAYQREKACIPIKLKMEQRGIRCDVKKIGHDLDCFHRYAEALERRTIKRLGCPKDTNLNSPAQLIQALERAGVMDDWVLTEKGNQSTALPALKKTCGDAHLIKLLELRSTVKTYINTFLTRWYNDAQASGGFLYPSYNTTRSDDEYGGKRGVGTRTGRLSSSNPNFQNAPGNVKGAKNEKLLLLLVKELKRWGIPDFRGIRDYIVPRKGFSFIRRDYAQQELRILAHYEDDLLLSYYLLDPRFDVHSELRKEVNQLLGTNLSRKAIKTVVFGLIYGTGVPALASLLELGEDYDQAKRIKDALFIVCPGVKDLNDDLKQLAKQGLPLRTWGGREYYCEEPRYIEGRRRTFEYKMINTLIQGSAADCTKEAMINCDGNWESTDSGLLIQVHDELLAEVPTKLAAREMRRLKGGMEAVEFDLPMLTDGEKGATSWARLTPTD